MFSQSSCKAVGYNGKLGADDLVLCCRLYGAFLECLRFSRFIRCYQERLVKLNLLDDLQLTD
jgi:hypothetical protein